MVCRLTGSVSVSSSCLKCAMFRSATVLSKVCLLGLRLPKPPGVEVKPQHNLYCGNTCSRPFLACTFVQWDEEINDD
jgi:hypothetical protein